MSSTTETAKRLTGMTDPAEFERIAAAVLRAANPAVFGNISHPGVQPGGKTVKSPFDNVGWVESADGSRFVCAAHTTEQNDLAGKWLHNPALVKPRKPNGKPTEPAGDLIKAISEVEVVRQSRPELKVTLALTTNRETPSDIRVAVEGTASAAKIHLDIWSVSRIADFLDTTADGQAIRRHYFGRPIELLSLAVLLEVGRESVAAFGNLPPPDELVIRDDMKLEPKHTLIVGPSGAGKTTICAAAMQDYLDAGNPAIVLRHELIVNAVTLVDALDAELRRQHPNLEEAAGAKALALCRDNAPLLVLVEDVNRAENPGALLNKITTWAEEKINDKGPRLNWRLFCPLWPKHLELLELKQKQGASLDVMEVGAYSDLQAGQAVIRRAQAAGRTLDELEAAAIASSLGNDALLIALHDFSGKADPHSVIRQYVQERFRLVAAKTSYLLDDVNEAVNALVSEILVRRRMNPSWTEVKSWLQNTEIVSLVRATIVDGTVMRLAGADDASWIEFRHDRVLGYLITQVAAERLAANDGAAEFLTDPFFSESVAAAVVSQKVERAVLLRLMERSPAIGAFAFKQAALTGNAYQAVAVDALRTCLSITETKAQIGKHFRWSVAQVLGETESLDVVPLIKLFPENDFTNHYLLAAAFRNGEFQAGAYWFGQFGLGLRINGQSQLFARVLRLHRKALLAYLTTVLADQSTLSVIRTGALNMAGYIGDVSLADPIRASWNSDAGPDLRSYLWAAARCCGLQVMELLGPVCDSWEELPDGDEGPLGTQAENLANHGVSWEFARHTPEAAVPFFVLRAQRSQKLLWPITYMLRAVDHPDAVEHIARFIAQKEGDAAFFAFRSLTSDWERYSREESRQMSASSKQRLLELARNKGNPDRLRNAAFRLWELTLSVDDVKVARGVESISPFYDRALWARARRRDMSVIPVLLGKVEENPSYWLQTTRYLGSEKLRPALERLLAALCAKTEFENETDEEYILSESLLRLPAQAVEELLTPRWSQLKRCRGLFQVALYFATPGLIALAAEAVRDAAEPKELFLHITTRAEIYLQQRHGVVSFQQLEALSPYLKFLERGDVFKLWYACTEHQWFDFRHKFLDDIMRQFQDRLNYLPEDIVNVSDLERDLIEGLEPYQWVSRQTERGAERPTAMEALFTWLAAHSGETSAFEIVAKVLTFEGTRADIARLKQYVDQFPEAMPVFSTVEFVVSQRTLT